MTADGAAPSPPTLLLDVMSTLVHDPFYDDVPAFLGLPLAELLAAKHPTAWVEFERGALDEAAFLPRFFADGRAYDQAGLKRTFVAGYRLLPGVEDLLRELAARHVLHLMSNYPAWWRDVEARTGLARFARWTFVSCRTGLRKPEEAAFRVAARLAGAPLRQCLFVDDSPKNVAAAEALGMQAVLFRDVAGLRVELERRGLLG